jgi:hypothetical protein
MAGWPPELRESKAQPQPTTSPNAIQSEFPNTKKSHRRHLSAQGIDVSPEDEMYKEQGTKGEHCQASVGPEWRD